MTTVVLTQEEVRALLPMEACIALVEDALRALARGNALNPLRWAMRLEDRPGLLGMMPARIEGSEEAGAADDGAGAALGIKVVAVFPENHGTRWDSHQGVVLLFDETTGVPRAILDASEVTAIRTAAASAAATKLLAREDATTLGILGSGVQAAKHLEAMLAVRPIERVRVTSPDHERLAAFAEREARRHGVLVEAVATARAAVEEAAVVCTATSAREPVLMGEWLAEGAHVNAVGACLPHVRELDSEALRRARLFTDRRESLLAEAGDFLLAREEGAVGEESLVGELGELLLGTIPGRRTSEEITLFESLGIAVEDVAVARFLDRRAREEGAGARVELGGRRD